MSDQDITLSRKEATELHRRASSSTTPQRDGRPARVILLAAQGQTRRKTARLTALSCPTITDRCKRLQYRRQEKNVDKPGRGRKSLLTEDTVRLVLEQMIQPCIGDPRCSFRSVARAASISTTLVHRLWSANDMKPHLASTLKSSNNPHCSEKFWEIIWAYLARHEKRQIHPIERTQPRPALRLGYTQTKSYYCLLHGAMTLFTALDYLLKYISNFKHQHQKQLLLESLIHSRYNSMPNHRQLYAGHDMTSEATQALTCTSRHPLIPNKIGYSYFSSQYYFLWGL